MEIKTIIYINRFHFFLTTFWAQNDPRLKTPFSFGVRPKRAIDWLITRFPP